MDDLNIGCCALGCFDTHPALSIIGRVVSLSPRHGDVFYLRMILHHVPVATSFEELRTVGGVTLSIIVINSCIDF